MKFKQILFIYLFILICNSCFFDNTPSLEQILEEQNDITQSMIEKDSLLNNFIFSLEDMLVQKNNNRIRLTRDGGKSWGEWISIKNIGFIRFIYVFQNSSLLICNDNKAFYSADWKTFKESNIYDFDGSVFVPQAPFHNFSAYTHDGGGRQIIDGKEIICWGTYSNEGYNSGFIPRIWYSTDFGKTIKCAFKFGETTAKNTNLTYNVRHVHCINFNSKDKSFWAQTGDLPSESTWLKGSYDLLTNGFSWELIGQGRSFLTTGMHFDKDYVYASWDVANGGLFKVRYEDISNERKREMVFSTAPEACHTLTVGKRGDMLITTTNSGHFYQPKHIYYSPDGVSFYPINMYIPTALNNGFPSIYYWTFGVNNNGKILAGIRNQSLKLSQWNNLPGIWLDDLVRHAGFPEAFKYPSK